MQPMIVIAGETASGKSALGLEIAQRFDGEIVAADAWTVYKDFTIGTAKPSVEERQRVPHHMLDVTTAAAGYSAALFKVAADEVIADILARGKVPIVVGGTGLYIDSLLFNYSFADRASKAERQVLDALDLPALWALAHERGLTLSAIDEHNKRRVVRLIENNGVLPTKQPLREHTLVMGMAPAREQLRARIELRVDAMLRAGLEAEVRGLAAQYGWDVEPMKGIGYREFRPYTSGAQTLDEVRQAIIRNTMQLAKKQRTWFRRNQAIQWFSDSTQALDAAAAFLASYEQTS